MNQDGRMYVLHETSARRRKARNQMVETILLPEDELDMQLPNGRVRSNLHPKHVNSLVRPLRGNTNNFAFIVGVTMLFMILLVAERDWVIHFNLDAEIVHSNSRPNNWYAIDEYQNEEIKDQTPLVPEKGRRVVYYSSPGMIQKSNRNVSSMSKMPQLEVTHQENVKQPSLKNECVPMREWQRLTYPVCNQVHEMDMAQGLAKNAFSLLGSGWFRNTWKVDTKKDSFVLKMLR